MYFGDFDDNMNKDEEISILQINTGIKDSSIPYRLMNALEKIGVPSKIITMDSKVQDSRISLVKKTLAYRFFRKIDFVLCNLEKKVFYPNSSQLPFSFYRVGVNLARNSLLQNADVLVIHWICGTFLSPYGLKKVLKLGKPTIIVCHDSWQFTGGCHVRLGCQRFVEGCGECPQLQSGRKKDWSYRLVKLKEWAIKGRYNICIVSPSHWMDENVRQSTLFKDYRHYVIPNPIDIAQYEVTDKSTVRNKLGIPTDEYVILFGAMNVATTPYKGLRQFIEALNYFETEELDDSLIKVYAFGASEGEERNNCRIKIDYLGYKTSMQMIELYNCADMYVMPSLDDNLPGTVMESLACEVPVVAFRTGGIPDMVIHKENGYLAEYDDIQDLARGMKWVMEHNENNILGENGRRRICSCFKDDIVAKRYEHLITKMLNER